MEKGTRAGQCTLYFHQGGIPIDAKQAKVVVGAIRGWLCVQNLAAVWQQAFFFWWTSSPLLLQLPGLLVPPVRRNGRIRPFPVKACKALGSTGATEWSDPTLHRQARALCLPSVSGAVQVVRKRDRGHADEARCVWTATHATNFVLVF